jgi:ribonuclease P protein component
VLPAPHRLRLRRDFGVATRRGRRAGSATVVVHLAVPDGVVSTGAADRPVVDPTAPVRVGFVVSAAVGPAVVRNRVRRRLRHLVAAHLSRFPDGTLLVLRALPAAAAATSAQLGADLSTVLERLVAAPAPDQGPTRRSAGVPA